MNGRAIAISIILGGLFGFFAATGANAYARTGCKYDPASISPISFRFFSVANSSYVDASKYGASAWNATNVPGYFQEQSVSLDPEVNITDDSYPTTNAYAWVSWTCSGGLYSGNEVHFVWNSDFARTRTYTQLKRIATHELGHAYGLDHVTSGCRIMRYDIGYLTDCSMTTPQADDVNGVNAIY